MSEQKDIFHIQVNQRQEFDISVEEVEAMDLRRISQNQFHLLHDHRSYNIELEEVREDQPYISLKINGKRYEMEFETPLLRKIRELGLAEDEIGSGEQVYAPMPGKVISVLVKENEEVEAGQDLLILEAMKMENMIKAGGAGTVKEITVVEGDAVDKNALLLAIEADLAKDD